MEITPLPSPRFDGVVPEVRVRGESLAAEGDRTHLRVRAVQSWLLLPLPRLSADGGQRSAPLHQAGDHGQTRRAVRHG